MALSYADVPAADVTRADNDNTILVGAHVLANDPTVGRWNTDGNLATADDTLAAFPVRYAFDRQLDIPTQRTTAATVSWLLFDRGAGTLADIDVAMIRGDFDEITCTEVALWVAEDPDVAGDVNSEEVETWTTFTDKRLVSRDLRDSGGSTNRRISGARYIGIRVTCSGSEQPQVMEVWLGKRVQMHGRELLPFSGDMRGSNYTDFQSEGRSVVRNELASGFLDFTPSFSWKDATLSSEFKQFLKDVSYGAHPFLYLHEPNTDIQFAAVVVMNSRSYVDKGGSVGLKNFRMSIAETAPIYESET